MWSCNLVNKTNLLHNLFLLYLSIFTCFGRLCAHHQEKQLNLCDTWYLLFCVDDCLVCIPDSHPYSCFSWWWAHSRSKRVEIDIYIYIYIYINILKINCAPSWFYLQDCTEMHGQRNMKFKKDERNHVYVLSAYYTGSSESCCALIKGVGSDVHERLYRPEPV